MNQEVNKKMNIVGGKRLNLARAVLAVLCLVCLLGQTIVAQSSYSLARYQTTPVQRNQAGRGACWAFGGVAALEAAYNRKYGLVLDLSEQYTFHMPKAMELQARTPENNTSLLGFQGSSDIVKHLTRFAVPEERFAPYLSDAQMQQLRVKLNVGDIINNPSQIGFDTFEFSEEHIPTEARWNARYRVTDYGRIANPSDLASLEQTLRDNHEIVADFTLRWKLNAQTNIYEYDANANLGGHVMLIIGYDRTQQVFIARNWWNETDYIRITYECMKNSITGAHFIKDVADPNVSPQKKARFLGIWNFDDVSNNIHIKGKLVIRRFTDFRSDDPNAPTTLGSLYTNGMQFDVKGYFTDDGDGLVLDIRILPGQPGEYRRFVYPFGFWAYVDRNYTGAVEKGTAEQPFRSFITAATRVPINGTIFVQPGSYAAVRFYNKPMTIKAPSGGATLGSGY